MHQRESQLKGSCFWEVWWTLQTIRTTERGSVHHKLPRARVVGDRFALASSQGATVEHTSETGRVTIQTRFVTDFGSILRKDQFRSSAEDSRLTIGVANAHYDVAAP